MTKLREVFKKLLKLEKGIKSLKKEIKAAKLAQIKKRKFKA
ncbi:hypothetical protein ACFL52_01250 [Candidatus Margulisiibacteriota bacterium]